MKIKITNKYRYKNIQWTNYLAEKCYGVQYPKSLYYKVKESVGKELKGIPIKKKEMLGCINQYLEEYYGFKVKLKGV